jgi:hypothetical protein
MNDPAARYHQLGSLVATIPDFTTDAWKSSDGQRWLGRVAALVEAERDPMETATLRVASDGLGGVLHHENVQKIIAVLHRALARAERAAPVAAQGAFIPVGASFTAVDALTKIFGPATASVLIVDPYADANLLTDFAVLVPEGVRVMVLADKERPKPALLPAAKAWMQQYGQARPLEVRLAPENGIHDRLIIVDDHDVWTVGQSFNALAKRAPTSMGRVDPETARMKVVAYRSIWMAADQAL